MRLTRREAMAGAAALSLAGPRFAVAQTPPVLRAARADIQLGEISLSMPVLNGAALGPALDLQRGQLCTLKIENALDFAFSFRTQGLRGHAVQGAGTPIQRGETREIAITPPDAGSFLYRTEDESGGPASRTIFASGTIIVTTDAPRLADRDIVLAVNTLILPAGGAAIPRRIALVNGVPALALDARPGERLRLRIVNLAPDIIGGLALPEPATVIARDGQPCEPFPAAEGVVILPPLGRADVLLDIPGEPGPVKILDAFVPEIALATIAVSGKAMGQRFLAKTLPDNTALPKEIPLQAATRISVKPGVAAADPIARVKAGTGIVLTFENTDKLHALLLDGMPARLLDAMDDGWKPWWTDALLVNPGETARLAFVPSVAGRFALDIVPLEGNAPPVRAWIDVV